jgi:hypothetical protein
MKRLTRELAEYLASGLPKQVLIKVKDTWGKRVSLADGAVHADPRTSYHDFLAGVDKNRLDLMKALQEERLNDNRVKFNPLGIFNQIALFATRDVIERIAAHSDVDEIIPDESTDVLDECED